MYIFDISISFLGGVFKYFSFSPLVGEMIQFDSYDPDGWPNHQDTVDG